MNISFQTNIYKPTITEAELQQKINDGWTILAILPVPAFNGTVVTYFRQFFPVQQKKAKQKIEKSPIPESFTTWAATVPLNVTLNKIELRKQYADQYYKNLQPHTFTKWIRRYAIDNNIDCDLRKSNGVEYITLIK